MFSFVGLLPFLHPKLLFFFAILLASKTDLEGSFFRGYVEILPKNAHLQASVIFLPGANRGCIGTYEPNETKNHNSRLCLAPCEIGFVGFRCGCVGGYWVLGICRANYLIRTNGLVVS